MSQQIDDLIQFIEKSPTSWHASHELSLRFKKAHFEKLEENEDWKLKPSKHYFIQRGGTIIAFKVPGAFPKKTLIAASHSDSPSLKIKPHAEFREHTMNMLRTEVYGGPQLSTWFDRDLTMAGIVYTEDAKGTMSRHLLHTKDHPFMIPSLAIHLQEKKDGKPLQYIDKQDHLCPLLGLSDEPKKTLAQLIHHYVPHQHIITYDLYLVPNQKPSIIGINQEFLASYRLDNLCSTHASLISFLKAKMQKDTLSIFVTWNHEEIGSETSEGASSPLLKDTIKRILLSLGGKEEDFLKLKSSSLCFSVDVGHAFHPNFSKRYDPQDHPLFGKGFLVKFQGLLKYATTADSVAKFSHLCKKHQLLHQKAGSHSEITGGSTVGPVMSTNLGIPTIDIGPALLGMHSTRELMCITDYLSLAEALKLSFETL